MMTLSSSPTDPVKSDSRDYDNPCIFSDASLAGSIAALAFLTASLSESSGAGLHGVASVHAIPCSSFVQEEV